jgi:protein TonB
MIPSEFSRLRNALFVALPIDALLWVAAGHAFLRPPAPDLAPIEIQRVVIDEKQRITPKVVKKEDIQKKVQKSLPKPPPPKPEKREPVQPKARAKMSPPKDEGAHNKVLTAKPTPDAPPDNHTALAGGNADVGTPTTGQHEGEAKVNPPAPPPPTPQPTPQPPPAPVVKPAPVPPPPPPVEQPKPEPKPEPPKPKGPTKDAEPVNQPMPEIPDELKSQSFKTFVRVAVEIDESGAFTVTLRTSSGNSEVDRLVLNALKRWKWKPALKEGEPIKSTQRFKFEFEVQ